MKIFAWAAVLCACLGTWLVVDRSIRSNLQASQLTPILAESIPELCDCEEQDAGLRGTCNSKTACTQCLAVCEANPSELAPIAVTMPEAPFVAVPYSAPPQPQRSLPSVGATCAGVANCPDRSDLSLDHEQLTAPSVNTDDYVPFACGTFPTASGSTSNECMSRAHTAAQLACENERLAAKVVPRESNDTHTLDAQIEGNAQRAANTGCTDSATASTITMRDKGNRTVATLKISSSVKRDYLKPEEREAIASTLTRSQSSGNTRAAHEAKIRSPRIDVYEDPATGHYTIDAQSMEIQQLAAELTARLSRPIRCHDSVSGTVSACVTDTSLTRALEKLVGPFGYSIATLEGCSVIGTPAALKYEALRLQDLRKWEEAKAARAQIELSEQSGDQEPAERLPPVQAVTDTNPIVAADSIPVSSSKSYEIAIGNKAKSLIAEGDLETTTALLQEAVSRHHDSAILHRMLAEVYLHRGMYLPARTAAQQSLAINRNNPMTNQIFGEVLKSMGEKTRAEHYLQQAKFLRNQAKL